MKALKLRNKFGLHVNVSFHDVVVWNAVHLPNAPIRLGDGGDVELPPPEEDGTELVAAWDGPDRVRVTIGGGETVVVAPNRPVIIERGAIRTQFSLDPQFKHPRASVLGEGNVVMAVAILAMTVFALQIEVLFREEILPSISQPPVSPGKEFVVKLLKDVEESSSGSGDSGEYNPSEQVARLLEEQVKEINSMYVPAGRITEQEAFSGGEELAEKIHRTPGDGRGSPVFQPVPEETAQLHEWLDDMPAPDGQRTVEDQSLKDGVESLVDGQDDSALSPAEKKMGWGFYDWYDARDARVDRDAIQEKLKEAKEQLAIDPDNPWALTQLGYYQYLAFDFEGCNETYARFIELYPSHSAGYNNQALVYKRLGEYAREEAFYRLAQALDPKDTYVLNNLAVNLAHQGRFDEALEIMQRLSQIQPDDPYADLHRAKIRAAMGEKGNALLFLEKALEGMSSLDTLHHIEFRQDIRVDPAFDDLRTHPEFADVLLAFYGEDAHPLLSDWEDADG